MTTSDPSGAPPAFLEEVEEERIEEVDVRPMLRRGEEPFERIMAAASGLPPNGVLRVRALFEPRPLYAVLGGRGFESWSEQLGEEDWSVWFWRPAETGDQGGDHTGHDTTTEERT